MPRKRFTEEQIAFALRQHEGGAQVAEIIRKLVVTEQAFYRWKKKFAGLGISVNEDGVRKHSFQQEVPQRVFYRDGAVGDW